MTTKHISNEKNLNGIKIKTSLIFFLVTLQNYMQLCSGNSEFFLKKQAVDFRIDFLQFFLKINSYGATIYIKAVLKLKNFLILCLRFNIKEHCMEKIAYT